uniref:Uncharacterized protein n=1 Tax=Romanomermis culicivorax TaxID=13658 RepID=A0A915KK47_ROMCU
VISIIAFAQTVASSKSIFDKSLAYVDLSDNLVKGIEKVGGQEANTGTKKLGRNDKESTMAGHPTHSTPCTTVYSEQALLEENAI